MSVKDKNTLPGPPSRKQLCAWNPSSSHVRQQASGVPATHSLGLQAHPFPFFVHCRGRRRGGPGKSTKNPMQVRPSLSSRGDSFPEPHFTNSTALAQREGRVRSCEPSGPEPSIHLTSHIPTWETAILITPQEDQQKPIDTEVVCRPTTPPPPLLALLIASLCQRHLVRN